ncbi:MAG: ATP-binding protein [Pseudonocardiaceae bacterium]
MSQPRLRSRAMTEQVAQTAIDQACRALRPPTIRTRVEEITAATQREQLTYWGFLAELLLAECEETASAASASNESFSGWTKTFTDPRRCAAIVDRLTSTGNIIETGANSYRPAPKTR